MVPFFSKKPVCQGNIYINLFDLHSLWTQGMEVMLLQILFLAIFPSKCISSDECSEHGLFSGVARYRDALSNAKVLVLHTKLPSKCEVGVRCKHFCLSYCAECNFFEMIKVSPIFASATFWIQETTTKTMCYCYKHSGRPVIQPSPMWHHGFIFDGTIVTGGKMLFKMRLFNVQCV